MRELPHQEWKVALVLIVAALFLVGDSAPWIREYITINIEPQWRFLLALGVITVAVAYRLAQLHRQIDAKNVLRSRIGVLNSLLISGNSVLGSVGHYKEIEPHMPMYMVEVGLPKMGKWQDAALRELERVAPEYLGRYLNDGMFRNTDEVAASVQQLEGRLKRMEGIVAELTQKL